MNTRPPIFGGMYGVGTLGVFGMIDPTVFAHHHSSSNSKKTIKKPEPVIPKYEPAISQYVAIHKILLDTLPKELVSIIALQMFYFARLHKKSANNVYARQILTHIQMVAQSPYWDDKGEVKVKTPEISLGFFKIEEVELLKYSFTPSAIEAIREIFAVSKKLDYALLEKIKNYIAKHPKDNNRKQIAIDFYEAITKDNTAGFLAKYKDEFMQPTSVSRPGAVG